MNQGTLGGLTKHFAELLNLLLHPAVAASGVSRLVGFPWKTMDILCKVTPKYAICSWYTLSMTQDTEKETANTTANGSQNYQHSAGTCSPKYQKGQIPHKCKLYTS